MAPKRDNLTIFFILLQAYKQCSVAQSSLDKPNYASSTATHINPVHKVNKHAIIKKHEMEG